MWVYNLRANPAVEIRDATEVFSMRVREIDDAEERARLWTSCVQAFSPYEDYKNKDQPHDSDVLGRTGLNAGWCQPSVPRTVAGFHFVEDVVA